MANLNPIIEEWRPVVGYEGWYEVSSLGRVRNIAKRNGTAVGLILRANPNGEGYASLGLRRDGSSVTWRVHILVAHAFMALPPVDLEVGHLDDDKMNPRLDNLEYTTHVENVRRGVRTGCRKKHHKGTQNPAAQVDEATVQAIRLNVEDLSYAKLAQTYGLSKSQVARIVMRQSWCHLH